MNVETASYKELKEYIKGKRASSEEAKDFFGDYTHSSTEELREMVEEWVDYYEQEEDDNYSPQDTTEAVSSPTCSSKCELSEVIELLDKASALLKAKTGYTSKEELKALHQKAMEIEIELGNQ